jgi:hypothetical protein
LIFNVLEIFVEDTKLVTENLSGLRKIMVVPKKLNDSNFIKNETCKTNLLRILKSSLRLVRDLNEQSKDRKFSKKKEFQDFVKNAIVTILKFIFMK